MKKLRKKKYERIIVAWCYLSYYYKHTFIPKTNPQKKAKRINFHTSKMFLLLLVVVFYALHCCKTTTATTTTPLDIFCVCMI